MSEQLIRFLTPKVIAWLLAMLIPFAPMGIWQLSKYDSRIERLEQENRKLEATLAQDRTELKVYMQGVTVQLTSLQVSVASLKPYQPQRVQD